MNVVQLTQYLALGGLERCVVVLAKELHQLGHETTVVVYEDKNLHPPFSEELLKQSIALVTFKKSRGFSLATLAQIYWTVKTANAQVIHTHDLGALVYGVLTSFLTMRRVKVVHTQHSFVHLKKGNSRYVLYERVFSRLAHSLCAVSNSVRDAYTRLDLTQKEVHTIPNGINYPTQRMSRQDALMSLKTRQSLHKTLMATPTIDRSRILLSMGRVVRGKGLERLISAWNRLSDSTKSKWKLIHVGPVHDARYLQRLTEVSQKTSVPPVFLPSTDQPFNYLQVADAFVSLSEEEGMPLAVYEATGVGLPVLLSDIPAHRPLKKHATLLPEHPFERDSAVLHEFLNQSEMHSTQDQWDKMATFRSSHSSSAMAQSYLRIYHSCLMVLLTLALFHSPMPGIAQVTIQPALTSYLEKPEYLTNEDWQENIKLSLAPSETTMITFKWRGLCGPLPKLSDEFAGQKIKMRWFAGVPIHLTQPSFEGANPGPYTDALIPIEKEISCNALENKPFDWIFADISVEASARAQTLQGKISWNGNTVSQPEDRRSSTWGLTIEVLPVKFDDVWSLPLRAEFTPYFAALAHYGRSGPEEGALTKKYIQTMYDHRMLPLKLWIKHPFHEQSERHEAHFTLSNYPTPALSFLETVLTHLPSWVRVDIPRYDSEEPADRLDYWKRWNEYIHSPAQEPIERRLKERIKQRPITYLWDEPTQNEFNLMYRIAGEVGAVAPSVEPLVTVYPWQSLQDRIKIFAPLLQTLMSEGPPTLSDHHELWSYVSCMSHGCGSEVSSGEPDFVIERNAAYIRVWPWLAEHYNLNSVLYYSVNNVYQKSPNQDPWLDLYDFTGNGDGTLFYPGRPGLFGMNYHIPIVSHRAKVWRQSSFDAEYIKLAKKVNPLCFSKIKNSLNYDFSAIAWSRQHRTYSELRAQLIHCIQRPT